ncbi:MAG: HAMP domain-containing protein [Abitibacteriaceae bacterium]|nr:HAMP domain-containing protein [Abditibacteriaceae bacterium]MBV9865383.1 HAMP domain-containing protein [Abditibacteriaceae bacterium]
MRLSFRARLALWNMVILALVLGGFGAAICYRVQASMAAAIDQELVEHARHASIGRARFLRWRARHHDHGPDQPPGQPGNATHQPPPNASPDRPPWPDAPRGNSKSSAPHAANPGSPGNGPADHAGTAANSNASLDADTERIANLRRPRMLDLHGKNMMPFNNDGPWDKRTFSLSLKGQQHYSTLMAGDDHLRIFSMPLRQDGQTGPIVGVVQVARELALYDRLLQDQVRTLLTLVPLALLITGLGGLFLTNRALRPVHEVTQAAAEIGAHDLARRLEVNGHDELAELASTFNGMIARLHDSFGNLEKAYAGLEAAYDQQRRFTADASHELRTPLARIKGSTSLALADEWSSEEYRHALAVADDAADKMNRIIQDLLLLARSDAGQLLHPDLVELSVILEHTVDAVPNPSAIPIRLDLPVEPLEIVGDADHLSRVFSNLLENAIRHTPAAGDITITAQAIKNNVEVTVADTGEGIAPQHLPHVFERFYRVDAARSRSSGGTGLGLAISQSIVQAHQGTIRVESNHPRGTRVIVTLPCGDTTPYLNHTSKRALAMAN